jgi:hypothetical protein
MRFFDLAAHRKTPAGADTKKTNQTSPAEKLSGPTSEMHLLPS